MGSGNFNSLQLTQLALPFILNRAANSDAFNPKPPSPLSPTSFSHQPNSKKKKKRKPKQNKREKKKNRADRGESVAGVGDKHTSLADGAVTDSDTLNEP